MSTNDDVKDDKSEDKPVTDADLAALKEKSLEVETPAKVEDEPKEEEENAEQPEEEAADDIQDEEQKPDEEEVKFQKKFANIKGDEPEEYAKNLEVAYDNSTTEALKWKKKAEDLEAQIGNTGQPPVQTDPALAYAKQLMDDAMNRDIEEFAGRYSQIRDPEQFKVLEKKVGVLSKAITQEEGRIPSMKELLDTSAKVLGWEPDNKQDKLGQALKDNAGTSKNNSATKQTPRSKVSAEQIKVARLMYPSKYEAKTDLEVAKDLESTVQ